MVVHTSLRHGIRFLNSLPWAHAYLASRYCLRHKSPVQPVLIPTHSTQVGEPVQVPFAWQTGAEPGTGTAPLSQVNEQLLPAVVGVVQLKVPPPCPVMSEFAGGLAHPACTSMAIATCVFDFSTLVSLQVHNIQ